MHTILAHNVNDAYRKGMQLLSDRGTEHPSRNGPVLRLNDPVSTVYRAPVERVLFDPRRDANPFFHLFEALWMLNGQNDLATLTHFLPSFAQFSDDGLTLHGAYGDRWRNYETMHTGFISHQVDQLSAVIRMLRHDPTTRRAIIAMWDVSCDLDKDSKDIPCNDMISCRIVDGGLDIIVFCRSNDIVYGCYGANAVHMSILHEYLASMIGIPQGTYTQISCDFHAYLESPYHLKDYFPLPDKTDPYKLVGTYPLVESPATFDTELQGFMRYVTAWTEYDLDPVRQFANPFFRYVALPMYNAFAAIKSKRLDLAQGTIHAALHESPVDELDWLVSARRWIQRRIDRAALKNHNEIMAFNPPRNG